MPQTVELKDLAFGDDSLTFKNAKGIQVNIDIRDVIGYHINKEGSTSPPKIIDGAKTSSALNLLYIAQPADPKVFKWTTETLNVNGNVSEAESLTNSLDEKRKGLGKPRKLVIFLNPIGGKQNARSIYQKTAGPLFELAGILCEVLVSERHRHFTDLVAAFDFSSVDGMVIFGGDGSVCEILNALMRKTYGQEVKDPKPIDIPMAVIPTGTGNGFSEGLYGVQNELTAILHVINGTIQPQPLMSVHSGGSLLSMSCCVIAYGLFSDVMYHTDKQRWLKKLRYAVVPLWVMLWKKQRLFNARVTYKVREIENEGDESQKEAVEKVTEKEFWGNFQCIVTFGGDIINERGQLDFNYAVENRQLGKGSFNLMVYKQCGRFSLMKSFGHLLLRYPDAFNKDFIDIYTTTSYKVQVLPPDSPSGSKGEVTADTQSTDAGHDAKSSENTGTGPIEQKSGEKAESQTEGEGEKSGSEQQESSAGGATSSDKAEEESEESYLQRLIDIDGEMFEITNNEYEVKMHPNMIRVFSSLSYIQPQQV